RSAKSRSQEAESSKRTHVAGRVSLILVILLLCANCARSESRMESSPASVPEVGGAWGSRDRGSISEETRSFCIASRRSRGVVPFRSGPCDNLGSPPDIGSHLLKVIQTIVTFDDNRFRPCLLEQVAKQ